MVSLCTPLFSGMGRALLCTICLAACLDASALAFAPPLSMQPRHNGGASRAVKSMSLKCEPPSEPLHKGSASALLLAPALALGLLFAPAAPAGAQEDVPRSGQMIFDTK